MDNQTIYGNKYKQLFHPVNLKAPISVLSLKYGLVDSKNGLKMRTLLLKIERAVRPLYQ
jgi:hypothetical protein